MRLIVSVLYLFLFAKLSSCNSIHQVNITDAGKDSVVTIQTHASNVSMVNVKVRGIINDTCLLNGVKINKGSVDTLLKLDWYSSNLVLTYKAYKATRGKLLITVDL